MLTTKINNNNNTKKEAIIEMKKIEKIEINLSNKINAMHVTPAPLTYVCVLCEILFMLTR